MTTLRPHSARHTRTVTASQFLGKHLRWYGHTVFLPSLPRLPAFTSRHAADSRHAGTCSPHINSLWRYVLCLDFCVQKDSIRTQVSYVLTKRYMCMLKTNLARPKTPSGGRAIASSRCIHRSRTHARCTRNAGARTWFRTRTCAYPRGSNRAVRVRSRADRRVHAVGTVCAWG
jgi:hypothetical protein